MAGRLPGAHWVKSCFWQNCPAYPPASLAVSSFFLTLKKQGSREHACFMTWFVYFLFLSSALFLFVRERMDVLAPPAGETMTKGLLFIVCLFSLCTCVWLLFGREYSGHLHLIMSRRPMYTRLRPSFPGRFERQ